MRRSILACGLLLALAAICSTASVGAAHATTPHRSAHPTRHAAAHRGAISFYSAAIRRWQTETRYWQRVMGIRRSQLESRSLESASLGRLRLLATAWRHREETARRRASHPPNLAAWLCIHRYEGAWADGRGPYYGGLQMDLSFQRAYGGWLLATKGTADHWTPLEQIWTAVRARRLRGYYPWPNTARFCGLL